MIIHSTTESESTETKYSLMNGMFKSTAFISQFEFVHSFNRRMDG